MRTKMRVRTKMNEEFLKNSPKISKYVFSVRSFGAAVEPQTPLAKTDPERANLSENDKNLAEMFAIYTAFLLCSN